MKPETLTKLDKLLESEQYPYEKGLVPRFAKALLGDPAPLIEAYRSSSGGQGANSRANFIEGIKQLETETPELLENGIPFPIGRGQETKVKIIPVAEAKKIVEKFS